MEVSEDLFVEYDEKMDIVGIELWHVRRNLFGEVLKYLNNSYNGYIDKVWYVFA